MNICFAYITPFHPERGGIGRVTHILTEEFHKRGHKVFYIIYPSAITVRHEYNYPAPLFYLPSSDCLSNENVEAYKNFLSTNNIDIVINQSGNFSDSQLWVKCKECGIPMISVLHANPWVAYTHLWHSDIYPLKNDTFIEKIKRIGRIVLYPKIKHRLKKDRISHFHQHLPLTDKVCTLSSNYFKEIDEICPGYAHKYVAIPNPNSYKQSQIKTDILKKKQILFIGLFGPQKQEGLVLRLWSKIYKDFPDWNLIIVGDGDPLRVKRLHNKAKSLDRVIFKGFINPLELQLESSVLCMTSMYEGWPMVLVESMQCGTVPILFNSFAAAKDIVEDSVSGMLIKPFNLNEYEQKLRLLMSDENLRKKMAENAQTSIKQYDVKNVVDNWEALFDSLKK